MVKTRILNWNLHKNLQYSEVQTALKILGPEKSTWPSQTPRFRIRRKIVEYSEIVRFCRRRGILDPLQLTQTDQDDGLELSSHVELLKSTSPQESESHADVDHIGTASARDSELKGMQAQRNGFNLHDTSADSERLLDLSRSWSADIRTTRPSFAPILQIDDPNIYVLAATAVSQMQSYCMEYISSPYGLKHKEPEVHQFTSHSRFQNHMQEGLAYFAKVAWGPAFNHFDLAFALLKEMLTDANPMAVTVFLLVVCILKVRNAEPVALQLIKHVLDLATVMQSLPTSLIAMLRSIRVSGEISEISLLCLRSASDVCDTMAPLRWKTFYVQERLCDALYHTKMLGEGSSRRAKLLIMQEALYGPHARNVLWTTLNVADDNLTLEQLEDAEYRFNSVLDRSLQLTGFNRAKIQVVALEGLAKTHTAKAARLAKIHSKDHDLSSMPDTYHQLLRKASIMTDEAIEMAEIWFEAPSMRLDRVRSLKRQIPFMATNSLDVQGGSLKVR